MVDLAYGQDRFNRESKSVLLRQPKKKEVQHCIDIKVSWYNQWIAVFHYFEY